MKSISDVYQEGMAKQKDDHDQRKQMAGILMDALNGWFMCYVSFTEQVFKWAENECKRGAEFMRYVRKEVGFHFGHFELPAHLFLLLLKLELPSFQNQRFILLPR